MNQGHDFGRDEECFKYKFINLYIFETSHITNIYTIFIFINYPPHNFG